jgi:hypothetical protein
MLIMIVSECCFIAWIHRHMRWFLPWSTDIYTYTENGRTLTPSIDIISCNYKYRCPWFIVMHIFSKSFFFTNYYLMVSFLCYAQALITLHTLCLFCCIVTNYGVSNSKANCKYLYMWSSVDKFGYVIRFWFWSCSAFGKHIDSWNYVQQRPNQIWWIAESLDSEDD